MAKEWCAIASPAASRPAASAPRALTRGPTILNTCMLVSCPCPLPLARTLARDYRAWGRGGLCSAEGVIALLGVVVFTLCAEYGAEEMTRLHRRDHNRVHGHPTYIRRRR